MKKIHFLVLTFLIIFGNSISAQKITKESCSTVIVNDKYIQQTIIYSDADFTYFTEFEKGKGKSGITSIAKFDKNLKFVSRVMLKDLFGNNEDIIYYKARVINNNLAIISEQKLEKRKYLYSICIIDKNLKILK